MSSHDDFLERIKITELEILRLPASSRRITIRTTTDLTRGKIVRRNETFIEFNPSTTYKISALVFALSILIIAIVSTFNKVPANTGGLIVAYAASIYLIILIVNQLFLDKRRNYKIRVDEKGIQIDATLYEWKNIMETAILRVTSSNNYYKYLIIAFEDGKTYEKFDLSSFISLNFYGFSMRLAKYIEYYKPLKSKKGMLAERA